MEAAEQGSLELRARGLFASLSDHSLFSRCIKRGRSGRGGCGSPKDGCGVGRISYDKGNVLGFSVEEMGV